jgi:tRNA(adenine34) deaminase
MQTRHQPFIKRCYELAEKSRQLGESPVGSLVVIKNEIIAEATENSKAKNDITCHAELEAIRAALQLLQTNFLAEATLYTTHEPCLLCAYAIRHYRIKELIYVESVGELGSVEGIFPLLSVHDFTKWIAPPIIEKYFRSNKID